MPFRIKPHYRGVIADPSNVIDVRPICPVCIAVEESDAFVEQGRERRKRLKLSADRRIGSRSQAPILEGKQTVSFARRVCGVLDPEEKQTALF